MRRLAGLSTLVQIIMYRHLLSKTASEKTIGATNNWSDFKIILQEHLHHDTLPWQAESPLVVANPAWLWNSQPRVVTPLGLEKSGRIEFSPWKWVPMNQDALKSMSEYAKGSGTFDGTQFPSFFRSWQLVFWRSSIRFTQNGVNMYWQCLFS